MHKVILHGHTKGRGEKVQVQPCVLRVGKSVLGCDFSHLNHDIYFWMAEVCLQELWQALYILSINY